MSRHGGPVLLACALVPCIALAQTEAPTSGAVTASPDASGSGAAAIASAPRPSGPALHVESPRPVRLQRRTGEDAPWTAFCESPCDEPFDGATQYRVSGEGIRPSQAFYVTPGADGSATVRVRPATLTGHRTGIGLVAGGGALIVAGAIVALAGSSSSTRDAQTNPTNGETANTHTGVMFVASALVVSGLAVGIAGGATTLDNTQSSVAGSVRLVDERAPSQGARTPLRLEARRHETTPSPAIATPFVALPLLQGTF